MNYLTIYEDEIRPYVYQSYLDLPHVEVHEGYVKFYTINPQEVYHD